MASLQTVLNNIDEEERSIINNVKDIYGVVNYGNRARGKYIFAPVFRFVLACVNKIPLDIFPDPDKQSIHICVTEPVKHTMYELFRVDTSNKITNPVELIDLLTYYFRVECNVETTVSELARFINDLEINFLN